jgi:hypothetical protein
MLHERFSVSLGGGESKVGRPGGIMCVRFIDANMANLVQGQAIA